MLLLLRLPLLLVGDASPFSPRQTHQQLRAPPISHFESFTIFSLSLSNCALAALEREILFVKGGDPGHVEGLGTLGTLGSEGEDASIIEREEASNIAGEDARNIEGKDASDIV